ncbi:MAG: hypothetical protein ICV73_13995, partial [Acetobacteraceae bacterium]|nr:hypothetical protein [Acetobacteraceae bacterium]
MTGFLRRTATSGPGRSPAATGAPPPLAVAPALLRRVPHLAAFFPDRAVVAQAGAPPGAQPLVLDGGGKPPAPARGALHATEGVWRAPAFGRRRAPVGLVLRDA